MDFARESKNSILGRLQNQLEFFSVKFKLTKIIRKILIYSNDTRIIILA